MRDIATIRKIAAPFEAVADEGGTIQAQDMVGLDSDPTHHTATSLRIALGWAGLSEEEIETLEDLG